MTTITYRNGVMACDSQATGDVGAWAFMKKIRKVEGHLVGACGDIGAVHWFLTKFSPDWLKKNVQAAFPGKDKADFDAIIVAPNKRIYAIDNSMLLVPVRSFGYIATGSGESVALGAMAAGASAINAVRAAIRHDKFSGGRVQAVRL